MKFALPSEPRFSSPVSGCPDPEPGFTGASSSEDSEFESESSARGAIFMGAGEGGEGGGSPK